MKQAKWILISAIVALTVIAAVAQELEVLSVNALGYIKKTLPPGGKMICLNLPLDSMSEASNVFGRTSVAQELPNGSEVSFWNEDKQQWSTGKKSNKGVWLDAQSNYVVKATEGFFLKTSNATAWVWTNAKPYTWP